MCFSKTISWTKTTAMITYRTWFLRRPTMILALASILFSLVLTSTLQIEEVGPTQELRDTVVRVEERFGKTRIRGRRIIVETSVSDLREGDVFVLRGDFIPATEQESAFYRRYLLSQGLFYTVKKPIIQKTDEVKLFYRYRAKVLGYLQRRIEERFRSTSYLWKALLYGDRTEFPREVREDFARAGLSHVLALSGFHVGILAMFLQVLLLPLSLRKRTTMICFILTVYALLTGLRPSIVRAVGFYLLYYLSFLFHRRYDLISALCIMCAGILLLHPLSILDVGFQLSFLSVLSIALFQGRMEACLEGWVSLLKDKRLKKGCKAVGSTLVLSISPLILSLPLAAYHFQIVPLLSAVSNLFVLPLISLIMTLFLVSMLLPAGLFLTDILVWGVNLLTDLMNKGIACLVCLPCSYLEIQEVPAVFMFFYYGVCIVWYINSEKKMIKENFYDIQRIEKEVG